MSNGPIEPHADLRQGATALFELFCAYVQAGFTEDQALRIVGYLLNNPADPS
jgi:hypothetical protein